MGAADNLRRSFGIFALSLGLAATAASAQGPAEKPAGAKAQDSAPRPSNAPYMKPLGRLATVLGSLHFLRGLCQDPNAQVWREKMNAILDAQAPNDTDRRTLVAHFNQGYRSFESTYRKCTPAATVAVERYAQEGADLSREISARYGN